MNLIAFDTSSSLFCATLLIKPGIAGQAPRVFNLSVDDGLHHAEMLMDSLDRLCTQANLARDQINAVVCGRGPGSFTGLRIGMAAAKGLSQALGCPLCSVSALDALAWGQRHWPGPVVSLIDARKNRFYAGVYFEGMRQGEFIDLGAYEIVEAVEARWKAVYGQGPILLTGPDAGLFLDRLADLSPSPTIHHAMALDPLQRQGFGQALAELGMERIQKGNWDTPETGPEYIRASDAQPSPIKTGL